MTDSEKRDQIETFKSRMRDADIPTRHASFRAAESACAEWTAEFESIKSRLGTGIIYALCGARGSGKTQLAVELIRAVCWAGRSAVYMRLMDFFVDIKSTYGSKSTESEADVIARYVKPSILVIDEAHERGGTQWESSMFNLLLDKRYAGMRDTILIANLDKADMPAALGPSIMRRLNDTGGMVECYWPSFGTRPAGQ